MTKHIPLTPQERIFSRVYEAMRKEDFYAGVEKAIARIEKEVGTRFTQNPAEPVYMAFPGRGSEDAFIKYVFDHESGDEGWDDHVRSMTVDAINAHTTVTDSRSGNSYWKGSIKIGDMTRDAYVDYGQNALYIARER